MKRIKLKKIGPNLYQCLMPNCKGHVACERSDDREFWHCLSCRELYGIDTRGPEVIVEVDVSWQLKNFFKKKRKK